MSTDVKYTLFQAWLKSNGYITSDSYVGYMKTVEKTLLVKDFDKIKQPALLKHLREELKANPAFAKRSDSDRSNILSGFKAYITFIEETNKK